MSKHFEDTSIFENVLEFSTPDGDLRAVREHGSKSIVVFERSGNSYIRWGVVRTVFNPNSIFHQYQKAINS